MPLADSETRPYRTFLATPILFAATALFLIILSCFSKPLESLAAFRSSLPPQSSATASEPRIDRASTFAVFCIAGAVPFYFQNRRSNMGESLLLTTGRPTRADRRLLAAVQVEMT